MKKMLSVCLVCVFSAVFLISCSPVKESSLPDSSLNGSGNTSDPNSAILSSPESITSVSGPDLSDNTNTDEIVKYMQIFVNNVCESIRSISDLEKLDLFNFLVFEAEEYAGMQGKTYAAKDAYESAYRYPVKDLQELSLLLFGFELDLTHYKDGTYFKEHGYLSNYYDSTNDEFFIVFVSPPSPASRIGLVSFKELLSIESSDSEATATCVLNFANDLGDSGTDKTAIYHFEIVNIDNLNYYQIKTVNFISE